VITICMCRALVDGYVLRKIRLLQNEAVCSRNLILYMTKTRNYSEAKSGKTQRSSETIVPADLSVRAASIRGPSLKISSSACADQGAFSSSHR
jgi:hypothetical protein